MNKNYFKAKTTREEAITLENRLFELVNAGVGVFEHHDFERGSFQWASRGTRAVIVFTEDPEDGSWDLSYEGEAHPCLASFVLAADRDTLDTVELGSVKEINLAITTALMSVSSEADEHTLREFLSTLAVRPHATTRDLEAGLDSARD